jgi:arsenate reductase-like glutaredoxin family protein
MVPGRHGTLARVATGPATAPVIQVFGLEGDRSTRAAIRFFKERRVAISFVDLRKRSIAPAELRRFADRLGARRLLDETARTYRDGGLAHLSMDDAEIVDRLQRDATLLRLPLIRRGNEVTVGRAESTWADWVRRPARA